MYTKDKKNRITLRLNDNQMNFVVNNSETLNKSPSDFIRMILDIHIAEQKMHEFQKIERGESKRRENEQANIYYQL